jgi:hypothetical protein
MSKNMILVFLGSIALVTLLLSCSDDPVAHDPEPSPYGGLSQQANVLNNLERSVNEQNYKEYKRLFDPEFVYTFSLADRALGRTPENWGRAHELAAVNNMFDPNHAGTFSTSSIALTLQYTDDNWVSFSPLDTLLYAGEQWYVKPVTYSFEIQTKSGATITGRDLKSQIVIRLEEGQWRIVEWQDDHLARSTTTGRGMANGTVEDITWGFAKSQYEEDPGYQDLSARDDVLINLELAYNGRNRSEYNLLLNPDLIFYFSDADVVSGIPYTQFDKEDEIITLTNMNDDTRQDRVLSINIDLHYPAGNWTVFDPDEPKYDGETWYVKTVVYNMTVQTMPNMTYVGTDMSAQFTVREVSGAGGARKWQIVRWKDDVLGGVQRADLGNIAAVQETTWGQVKALYR